MKRTPLKRKTPLKAATKRSVPKRKEKPAAKKKKKKAITTSSLQKQLWRECKRIIRERHGNTCYTCYAQGLEGSNWQTGHFIPSSVCSVAMRYDLDNLRPQCMACNIHRSGNWPAYEQRLVQEFGAEHVAALKQRNLDTKGLQYDRMWYEEKIAAYKHL